VLPLPHGFVNASVDVGVKVWNQLIVEIGLDSTFLPDEAVPAMHLINTRTASSADPHWLHNTEAKDAATTLGVLVTKGLSAAATVVSKQSHGEGFEAGGAILVFFEGGSRKILLQNAERSIVVTGLRYQHLVDIVAVIDLDNN